MRRLLSIAVFFAVVAVVSATAQRGGMHSSGGGHGGFSGHSGFVGHGSSGPHIGGAGFSGGHISSGFGSHFGPGSRSFSRGDRSRGGRFHDRGFRRGCFGCFGYGYPYNSYYVPYWWSDSYSSYDADTERERQEADEMNAENLDEQRMRQQDQDAYAQPRHGRMSVQVSDPRSREEENEAPTTALVFNDQHVEEVKNYAIAGGTLWVLNDHQAGKKIPLAQLDLAATAKMNDDRGVDFQVPR
jgi:hypothetical protein